MKALFTRALELTESERGPWIEEACGGNAALRDEVVSLLAHVSDAPLFDERGPLPAATAPPTPRAIDGASAGDPLNLVGVTLDDRYRVRAFVAEGGFGHVYRAEHLRWSRPVAVKLFKPYLGLGDQEALREAFVKEGALLNALSRKTTAIVQSYDVGTWTRPDGSTLLFTVLEWLEGRSLADASTAGEQWPLERVIETLAPVAEALRVAHESGVAHRDVKPRNIFLVDEAGAPAVKLLDFGVAKVAAERRRGFESTGGKVTAFTLDYAAPEQLAKVHGPTGPWTDVYALALVCVELLCGRRPYGTGDVLEAMRRARDPARRPTPRTWGVAVPDAVERVFARALAVEPGDRYADVARFWTALEEARRPPGVAAPIERRPASRTAAGRRAPWAWAVGAAAALALVTWLIGAGLEWR